MFLKLDKFYDCMVPIGSIRHMQHILCLYETTYDRQYRFNISNHVRSFMTEVNSKIGGNQSILILTGTYWAYHRR
eukprot:COSAG01_NODE_5887_length_3969_cov_4.471576_3_plen_75_part_00